jgi:hypothetical protein
MLVFSTALIRKKEIYIICKIMFTIKIILNLQTFSWNFTPTNFVNGTHMLGLGSEHKVAHLKSLAAYSFHLMFLSDVYLL